MRRPGEPRPARPPHGGGSSGIEARRSLPTRSAYGNTASGTLPGVSGDRHALQGLADGRHVLLEPLQGQSPGFDVGRAAGGDPLVHINPGIGFRLAAAGMLVGFLSGFFGIGGGFLIVPAIMLGSRMTAINAVGSSLVSVGAFGTTTAASYALAGLVDWRIAAAFIAGGIAGGLIGVRLSVRLSEKRGALSRSFAVAVVFVAVFVLWKSSAGILR